MAKPPPTRLAHNRLRRRRLSVPNLPASKLPAHSVCVVATTARCHRPRAGQQAGASPFGAKAPFGQAAAPFGQQQPAAFGQQALGAFGAQQAQQQQLGAFGQPQMGLGMAGMQQQQQGVRRCCTHWISRPMQAFGAMGMNPMGGMAAGGSGNPHGSSHTAHLFQ